MRPQGPSAVVRRLWPQRLRTRLAVFYSLLFLSAGLGLMALAYTLAINVLVPTRGPRLGRLTSAEQAALRLCKPTPGSKTLLAECQHLLGLIGPTQNGDLLAAVKVAAAIAVVLLAIGAVALGWLTAERALRPVRSITEAARHASELRLGERLALSGPDDELKQLADTFDLMLERIDAAFTSQKRFMANAAHELRTPLTAMRTAIEVTLSKPERSPEQLEEMAERVRRSVAHAEATIEALLTLATSELGATAADTVDLATAAEDAIDASRTAMAEREITVDTALDPAPARGDRVLLERMIANLVENAVRHNNPGGWIGIRTTQQAEGAIFEIANTGPHIPADQIQILFEPFARVKQRVDHSDGVGLGLSIASAIAGAHSASITARPRPGGGLELSVSIPTS
jgi:signal transduction histidine kinase